MEEAKETARINCEATKRTVSNDRYREMLSRFRHCENLAFFPFSEFPVDQKIEYYESLTDNRVLTFAAKGIWSEADLDELCGRDISYQERLLFQFLDRCWLHSVYQFQEAMDRFNLCPRGRRLIEDSKSTALLQNDEISRIEKNFVATSDDDPKIYRRTRYIAGFSNHARGLLDAMFARILFAHDKGNSFFEQVRDYLDNRSPLRTEPPKEYALKLSLIDALEFGAESLKWKYRVDEEQWIFEDVVNIAGRWEKQFKDPVLNITGTSVAEINAVIKELTGKSMTRTTSQHIRKLIKRMKEENLAKFDTESPITWLCLNNIIQSNHKIDLPRQLRHNKRNTRKGSQGYSVQQYIKRWIELGDGDTAAMTGGSPKKSTRQEAPFMYSRIHTWLLQYISYANVISFGIENEYATSKRLQFEINRQFVNAFRCYNYQEAIESISEMVSDIYRIFCDCYIETFFEYCDQYGVKEILRQAEEHEQRIRINR